MKVKASASLTGSPGSDNANDRGRSVQNMAMFGTKTFGEKPKPFQIEEDGEFYYIGSEVIIFFIIEECMIILDLKCDNPELL